MKFNFRKIACALASTAMVGSTVALAAAASYPAPFVEGGAADVTVVYGAQLDMPAVIDISASLSTAFLAGGEADTVTVGDDFAELGRSNDRLNLGNAMNAAHTSVDEDDMDLLANGVYTADDNDDFDYEQKITLASTTLTHFRDSEYEDLMGLDDKTPVLGYSISDGSLVMNYSIDFTDQPESDVVSGDLDDFEGSDITILGKNYYISDAKNGTGADGFFGKFTLLDSANTATVKEGETKTLDVDGVEYVVSIDFIDSDSASLLVNGFASDDLAEGSTEKLDDGSYLGIRDVRKLEVAGEIGSVEFSIGSGKLELTSGNDIVMNDDSIADVKAYFKVSGSKLDEIVIEWYADGDLFITEENSIVMPGFNSVMYSMNGLVRTDEETISIENDGDDSMELSVPIKDGTATFNMLWANSTGEFQGIGKSATERLATSPSASFTYYDKYQDARHHEYMVASYASGKDSESYLLRVKTNEDTSAGRNETTITNVLNGDEWSDRKEGDIVDIGDVSLTIGAIVHNNTDKSVVLTAGSNVNFSTMYTDNGLKLYLPYGSANGTLFQGAINFSDGHSLNTNATGHSSDSFWLFMDGRDKDSTLEGGTGFNVTIDDNSDGELEVSQVNTAGSGGAGALEIGSSNAYEKYMVDDVAPRIMHYTDGDQDYAEVFYPMGEDAETYADLVLASLGSSEEAATSLGNVYITDLELASSGMAENNLIVVGGSCINSVAASLLNGAGCESSWEDATGAGVGQYVVETFAQDNGKIATLVAGWDTQDTADAATFLTTGEVSTDAGSKYIDGALVA